MKVYKKVFTASTLSTAEDPHDIVLAQLNEEIPAENVISIQEEAHLFYSTGLSVTLTVFYKK
jgi:hypothetical protein